MEQPPPHLGCIFLFGVPSWERGGPKGGGKSNVLVISLFLLVFLLFGKVLKGTPNLRKHEGKGKTS